MALSMVHLLAARRFARERKSIFNCPEYYLGAIAPDAMHVRFKDDKSRKNEFHLGNWTEPNDDQVFAYWKGHSSAFDLGYGVHVMTDARWIPRIKRSFPDLVNERGAVSPMPYYADVYQTDYALFEKSPERPEIFRLLASTHAPKDHPLLTAAEIETWRDMQLRFYDAPCPYSEPVRHIDVPYIFDFLNDLLPELEARIQPYFPKEEML